MEQVPESLYRFFAEEVFSALGDEVQEGLTALSVAPVLDRELAGALLGGRRRGRSAAAALDVGILVERGSLLELHPLARSFLEERSSQLGRRSSTWAAVQRCLDHYRERRDWDAAFDLIARNRLVDEIEPLLRAALDELLDTARLSTMQTWCEFAYAAGSSRPRSPSRGRRWRSATAVTRRRWLTPRPPPARRTPTLAFRSLYVAGRAAHLASREEDALELYRRAEAAAATESERRDARWGQLMCAVELETA